MSHSVMAARQNLTLLVQVRVLMRQQRPIYIIFYPENVYEWQRKDLHWGYTMQSTTECRHDNAHYIVADFFRRYTTILLKVFIGVIAQLGRASDLYSKQKVQSSILCGSTSLEKSWELKVRRLVAFLSR